MSTATVNKSYKQNTLKHNIEISLYEVWKDGQNNR